MLFQAPGDSLLKSLSLVQLAAVISEIKRMMRIIIESFLGSVTSGSGLARFVCLQTFVHVVTVGQELSPFQLPVCPSSLLYFFRKHL